ncbi:aliphatic sulfonate ABC transporter substrate-binding protein [Paenibacillus flagellatus]|uniref:Putative aliphatic sulfonates-binding protein n=1 Tax=Paenibacillus flagellatus TaxID=2211139 RepID=A0A2V5K6S8_9BACL|nr:aliphatic sulfonate ABC transporter substrate-binding protein [Paenibacillus flagellatus]PYI54532.1 aliphatic sulfonates ABC transporter substrate-binding protein [Paenibacillus flagellatus]
MRRMKTTNPILTLALAVLLTAAAVTAGCAPREAATKPQAGGDTGRQQADAPKRKELKTVRFNYVSTYVPLMFSKNKGWMEQAFAKEGIKVEWSTFPTGAASLEAIAGGHLDIGSIAPLPPITAAANGVDLKLVATYGVFGKGNALVVHKDSPIRTLEDLKGKKIGVAKGTMAYDLVLKALGQAGLKPSDAQIIQLLPDEGQAAFESKNVDVWGIWDPILTTVSVKTDARALTDGEKLGLPTPNFVMASGKFAKEYPEYVELFLKVNRQAAEWMRDHPEEAIDYFSGVTKVDKEVVRRIAANNPVVYEPITDRFVELEKQIAKTALADGTIKKEVDPVKIVDNSFIENVMKQPLEKIEYGDADPGPNPSGLPTLK